MAFEQAKLLRPLYLLLLSISFIPITVFDLVTSLQFGKLTSPSAFQHAWFGRFWSWFGPQSAENSAETVGPLLRQAKGVVLDIGPGSGQWLYHLGAAKNPNITKVYGVEPNHEHHAALRRNITRAGLDGIYEVLPVGVEHLGDCGIAKGSVDTIATIQVLCSVPGPQSIVKELYPYLKPGGQWLVYEHIKTPHSHKFVGFWQSMDDPRCDPTRVLILHRFDR